MAHKGKGRTRHGRIVKASTVTDSKRGYFVFSGSYPHMKATFHRSKRAAEKRTRRRKI